MDATRVGVHGGDVCFMAFATGGRPRERWIVVWDEGNEWAAESVLDRWASDPELSLTEQEAWAAKAQMRGESGLTMEEMADWIMGLRDHRSEERAASINAAAALILPPVMAVAAIAVIWWLNL